MSNCFHGPQGSTSRLVSKERKSDEGEDKYARVLETLEHQTSARLSELEALVVLKLDQSHRTLQDRINGCLNQALLRLDVDFERTRASDRVQHQASVLDLQRHVIEERETAMAEMKRSLESKVNDLQVELTDLKVSSRIAPSVEEGNKMKRDLCSVQNALDKVVQLLEAELTLAATPRPGLPGSGAALRRKSSDLRKELGIFGEFQENPFEDSCCQPGASAGNATPFGESCEKSLTRSTSAPCGYRARKDGCDDDGLRVDRVEAGIRDVQKQVVQSIDLQERVLMSSESTDVRLTRLEEVFKLLPGARGDTASICPDVSIFRLNNMRRQIRSKPCFADIHPFLENLCAEIVCLWETLGSRDFVNAHYELLPKDMKRTFVKVSHDSHDGREEPLPVGDRSRTGPRRVPSPVARAASASLRHLARQPVGEFRTRYPSASPRRSPRALPETPNKFWRASPRSITPSPLQPEREREMTLSLQAPSRVYVRKGVPPSDFRDPLLGPRSCKLSVGSVGEMGNLHFVKTRKSSVLPGADIFPGGCTMELNKVAVFPFCARDCSSLFLRGRF